MKQYKGRDLEWAIELAHRMQRRRQAKLADLETARSILHRGGYTVLHRVVEAVINRKKRIPKHVPNSHGKTRA